MTIRLTDRDMDLLPLMARGLTGARIAERLDLSLSYIETRMVDLRSSFGVPSRSDVVDIAVRAGLGEEPS